MGEENNNNNIDDDDAVVFVKTTTTTTKKKKKKRIIAIENTKRIWERNDHLRREKFHRKISNERIQSILKTCGNLTEWKRTRDIEAPFRYKPFGFATFETLEGVLAAMRVLDRMQLYENVDDAMKAA